MSHITHVIINPFDIAKVKWHPKWLLSLEEHILFHMLAAEKNRNVNRMSLLEVTYCDCDIPINPVISHTASYTLDSLNGVCVKYENNDVCLLMSSHVV